MDGLTLGPTFAEILEAQRRIGSAVRRTPIERSSWLSQIAGHDIFLKLECWQPTRSFKVRGAANAIGILREGDEPKPIVTASAGNHGQAVALAARDAGMRATIFVPNNAPEMKKARIRSFGAELNDDSASYDDAEVAAMVFAADTDASFVHAYSDRAVVAGQGTAGVEIFEEIPDIANVIVPIGGGGLIAGVGIAARALAPRTRVIGVQSTETAAMHAAFEKGAVVEVPVPPTIADGLAGQVDEISFSRARPVVDQIVLVEEDTIRHAIRQLFLNDGIVAEGAAATAAAAIIAGSLSIDGPTVLIITGGNIDAQRFAGILASA